MRLLAFASDTVDAAAKLGATAQGLRLTVGQVQELSYVAEASGSSMQKLGVGIGMFERQAREFGAGRGGQVLQATFDVVGLTAMEARDALTGPEGMQHALDKISYRFQNHGRERCERAALASRLFGARASRDVLGDIGTRWRREAEGVDGNPSKDG